MGIKLASFDRTHNSVGLDKLLAYIKYNVSTLKVFKKADELWVVFLLATSALLIAELSCIYQTSKYRTIFALKLGIELSTFSSHYSTYFLLRYNRDLINGNS